MMSTRELSGEPGQAPYDLILGRVSVEAESRRPLYGTTAALDSRAQRFFDDRREPMYILLKIPMLAIAGAAAFFVRGWPGEAVRGVAAAVGLALVIRLTGIVQADITRQIEEFGREL